MPPKKKHRRARGQGTINYRKSDKRWQVEVPFPSGRVYRYAETEREAEAVRRELVLMRDTGRTPNDDRLEKSLERWLDARRGRVAEQTWVGYEQVSRLYLVPRLGKLRTQEVSPADVESFLGSLARDRVGPRQQLRCYQALSNCYNWLLRLREVSENPTDFVDRPRYKSPKKRSLTLTEAQRVLERVEFEPLGTLWALLLIHGLRISEGLGLTWDHVDFTSRTIHIVYQLSKRGELVRLKTDGSERSIPMSTKIHELLETDWLVAGKPRVGLVFQSKNLRPLIHRNVRKTFDIFLRDCGISDITPHQFRHTASSLMAEKGIHPAVVRELLGHEDTDQTLRIYTHATDEGLRRAVNWTDDLLSE